jgi:hypothetical protein
MDAQGELNRLRMVMRRPIIAEIGGFRPPTDPLASWFAQGVYRPGEDTKDQRGRQMFPLLQIRVLDLPVVPPAFAGLAVVVVWITPGISPNEFDDGIGWRVVEHADEAGLVPFALPFPAPTRPFPIRWRDGEPERPGWEEAGEYMDAETVLDDDGAHDAFHGLPHHCHTKIGGFPTEIQHFVSNADSFVFQIGSEEKPRWMWVDNGVATFGKEDGVWNAWVQFY